MKQLSFVLAVSLSLMAVVHASSHWDRVGKSGAGTSSSAARSAPPVEAPEPIEAPKAEAPICKTVMDYYAAPQMGTIPPCNIGTVAKKVTKECNVSNLPDGCREALKRQKLIK